MEKLTENQYRYYTLLCMGYITTIICSIIFFDKFLTIGSLLVSASLISYSLTYLFENAITEVYGFILTRRLIWMTVLWGNTFTILCSIIIKIHSPLSHNHDLGYQQILQSSLRASIAGTVALILGSYVSALIISKTKVIFIGKNYWLRTCIASAIGELINTAIVFPLGMLGTIPTRDLLNIMLSTYLLKLIFVFFQAPLSSILVFYLKKAEGLDWYSGPLSQDKNALSLRG